MRQLLTTTILVLLTAAIAGAAPPGFPGNGPPGFPSSAQPDLTPTVQVEVSAGVTTVRPGDPFPLAVHFELKRDWHINVPNPPQDGPGGFHDEAHPSRLVVTADADIRIGPAIWPEGHELRMDLGMGDISILGYENRATVYVPVEIATGAADGPVTFTFEVEYQACDYTQCEFPSVETRTLVVDIDASAPIADWSGERRFRGFDASSFETLAAAGVDQTDASEAAGPEDTGVVTGAPLSFSLFGAMEFRIDPDGAFGPALIMLVAALGGFLLNLTPCVLPVLPIKVMSLASSGGTRRRKLMLGLFMFAGIIAFWMVLAGLIISLASFQNINSLFQRPWFGIGVGLFILVMGIGMLGAFSVQLPQFVYRVNPGQSSAVGSFGFGVMTAILSTPCTAPFMGTAAAWATQEATDTSGRLTVIAIFAAIGVGMGAPYVVLSIFPKLTEKLPRTGPASELLKQVLGGLLIAVALFFGGAGVRGLLAEHPWLGAVLHWWLVVIAVAVTSLWLIIRTFQLTPSFPRRTVFTAIGLLLTAAIGWWTLTLTKIERSPNWPAFDQAAFESAMEAQQVVLIEFTADW